VGLFYTAPEPTRGHGYRNWASAKHTYSRICNCQLSIGYNRTEKWNKIKARLQGQDKDQHFKIERETGAPHHDNIEHRTASEAELDV